MGSIAEWTPIFAPRDPLLSPRMLLPGRDREDLPFPFSSPAVRYPYLGRNGIYGAVRALGLAEHEVLMPVYFHGVELETLLEAGVRVRFYPVRGDMRVDPDDIVAAISPETRAIYVIHYVGFPAPIREIAEICRQRDLSLIEDCALALLSEIDGKPLGSFGDAAIFCLYKWLPVPNGGALVLNAGDPSALPAWDDIPPASALALATLSILTSVAVRVGAVGRSVKRIGRAAGRRLSRTSGVRYVPVGSQHLYPSRLGFGMSPLSRRVIGKQDYGRIAERRRANYELLSSLLAEVAPPVTGTLLPGVVPLFYPARFADKQRALELLHEGGVEAVNYWTTYHPLQTPGEFPEADDLRRTVLELPIHQDLSPRVIERLAHVVRDAVTSQRSPAPTPSGFGVVSPSPS